MNAQELLAQLGGCSVTDSVSLQTPTPEAVKPKETKTSKRTGSKNKKSKDDLPPPTSVVPTPGDVTDTPTISKLGLPVNTTSQTKRSVYARFIRGVLKMIVVLSDCLNHDEVDGGIVRYVKNSSEFGKLRKNTDVDGGKLIAYSVLNAEQRDQVDRILDGGTINNEEVTVEEVISEDIAENSIEDTQSVDDDSVILEDDSSEPTDKSATFSIPRISIRPSPDDFRIYRDGHVPQFFGERFVLHCLSLMFSYGPKDTLPMTKYPLVVRKESNDNRLVFQAGALLSTSEDYDDKELFLFHCQSALDKCFRLRFVNHQWLIMPDGVGFCLWRQN